jgi:hypothetical protein
MPRTARTGAPWQQQADGRKVGEMHPAAIVLLLTLAAMAVAPLLIAYDLWLMRAVVPTVLRLHARLVRPVLALSIALPWIVAALTVLWIER